MFELLSNGYGLVGLYSWGFFGFYKNLFRTVGFMDERYISGEYEDCDYLRRMKEKDIAAYISFDVPYIHMPSSWNKQGIIHFKNKCERLLEEEIYSYDLGPINGNNNFLDFNQSHLEKSENFINVKMINNTRGKNDNL